MKQLNRFQTTKTLMDVLRPFSIDMLRRDTQYLLQGVFSFNSCPQGRLNPILLKHTCYDFITNCPTGDLDQDNTSARLPAVVQNFIRLSMRFCRCNVILVLAPRLLRILGNYLTESIFSSRGTILCIKSLPFDRNKVPSTPIYRA